MSNYGWIGKREIDIVSNRNRSTDTAEYIKYFAERCGAQMASVEHVRSKNLMKRNGKFYYILSIGKGKTTWAPYPQILELQPTLILTRDIEEERCSLWCIEFEQYKELELKLNKRDKAGDYYSLPLSLVREFKKTDVFLSVEDKNNEMYIKNVLESILEVK